MTSWKTIPADRYDVAVAGGGASGMTAAIAAARSGARVALLERGERPGKKILMTGNGKCNLGNRDLSPACYYSDNMAVAASVLERFGTEETIAFFSSLGLMVRERGGYLYPFSGQAATVLDVLRYEMERLGIEICAGCRVTGIDGPGNPGCRLTLETETAAYKKRTYDAVILACGGRAAPKTGSDGTGLAMAKRLGHRIVPTVPALTALRCRETFWKQVAGVRCEARLMLYIDGNAVSSVQGELQLTDYGISGIPVFQFSRIAAYALQEGRTVTVKIDLMPDPGAADTQEAFWAQRWERQKRQSMEQFVTGTVNKKVGLLLLKLAGIRETETVCEIEGARRRKLEQLFHAFEVTVKGTNSFEQAQVCAGGVDFAEVTDRLESVRRPGLFFAGEMLDIDGICGGYNLQWAWSSGAVAGRAAAGKAEFCPKKSRRPDVAHKMPDGKDM